MAFIEWQPNSENEAKFQLVDSTVTAVTGLGSNFMFDICLPGTSVFTDGTGSKLEIGRGWYKYISPSAESAILGELAVTASGVGTTQQNLTYQIGNPQSGFGGTATTIQVDSGGTPQDGAAVWVTSDAAGAYLVAGTLTTNSEGNVTFYLDAGTYYVWAQKAGVNFTNPTTITVS
jgi:hypothetical protein